MGGRRWLQVVAIGRQQGRDAHHNLPPPNPFPGALRRKPGDRASGANSATRLDIGSAAVSSVR
eukprot:5659754-Lingulodinium_polyedra.AAC.1